MIRQSSKTRFVRSRGRLVAAAAVLFLVVLFAVAANAEITKVDPASGEVEQGGSVTADVTVSVSGVLSATCLVATSDAPLEITVTFDELLACGGSRIVGMTVEVAETIEPGDYVVTIEEVDLGDSLLNTYDWPLTVTSAPTTSSTTTTSSPTTTSSTSTTTTTTSPSGTTSTTDATSTTTTTSAPTTQSPTDTTSPTTTTTSTSSGDSSSTTTAGAASTTTESSTSSTGSETGTVGPARGTAGDDGTGSTTDEESTFSEIALSSGLLEVASRALPPVFAEAVISPLVIIEVLLRSLARTLWSLLLPLGMTTLLGFGMIWRLRVDPESLEDHQMDSDGDGETS